MILINNDLIWLSVPRCASYSIESALFSSDLDIKYAGNHDKLLEIESKDSRYSAHLHSTIEYLYKYFGYKETICISRDWLKRLLSAFQYMFTCVAKDGFTSIVNFEDLSNDFIYQNFDIDFSNKLYSDDIDDKIYCYSKFVKEDIEEIKKKSVKYISVKALSSQNYYKSNQKCTYEFDITELDKFEEFIRNRYNVDFNLKKLNESKKINSKIVIDDELKNWLWKVFEYPFQRKITLI